MEQTVWGRLVEQLWPAGVTRPEVPTSPPRSVAERGSILSPVGQRRQAILADIEHNRPIECSLQEYQEIRPQLEAYLARCINHGYDDYADKTTAELKRLDALYPEVAACDQK